MNDNDWLAENAQYIPVDAVTRKRRVNAIAGVITCAVVLGLMALFFYQVGR